MSSTENDPATDVSDKPNCLKRASDFVVNVLEGAFYRLGLFVGTRPWIVVGCSFLFLILCLPGVFLFFEEENRLEKLWIPADSRALKDKRWALSYFPTSFRRQPLIVVDDNVLNPEVLRAVFDLDERIRALEQKDLEQTWESKCAKVGGKCLSQGVLEFWSFNKTKFNEEITTIDDVIHTINTVKKSPVYGTDIELHLIFGQMEMNGNTVVRAKAANMFYALTTNATSDDEGQDDDADAWELDFIDLCKETQENKTFQDFYFYATRSFGDESGAAIFGDITLLGAGYALIITYVCIVLGRMNTVQHRTYVSLCGILCIGLAIGITYGLCSYMQVFYGPVHGVLPFLLLGIGVDDMFVIVQAWETLSPKWRDEPVHIKIANMMKDAGVSITVTSITDILAFSIGASTILPALRSFCIWAAVGILGTFLYQATFFVACLAIDQRRVLASRDACCFCYIHKDYTPSKCSQRSLMQTFFDKFYAPAIVKLPIKICIVFVAAAVLGGGIYGVINLEQDFDPFWFFPSDSYAAKYWNAQEKYFPDDGRYTTAIYFGPNEFIRYADNALLLESVYNDTVDSAYTYTGTVDAWFMEFKNHNGGFPEDETDFFSDLHSFLNGQGFRFKNEIKWENGEIQASRMKLKHKNLDGAREEIKAMEDLRKIADNAGFAKDQCRAYSRFYSNFETNKVIENELFRNLGLAFASIFLVILLLIANFWTCLMVSLCVIMSVIDVGSLMYFWGLTIDTVTTVCLILAIGLAVDYSAHIGHSFMTVTGSRNERTKKMIHEIAPAVFNGGFSTFLAFILLANSTSYIFKTFFKIFFGVVIFGLFHGLLLLPVLLSWFGPAPYTSAYQKHENEKSTNDNTMVQNNYVMPDTRDSSKNEIEKDGNNTSRNEGDQDRSDSVIKEGGHDNPAMDHGENV